jgi:glutathione-specific gamma-glutamylcyclotransferase
MTVDPKKANAAAVEALATVTDHAIVRLTRADGLSREDLESGPIRDLIAREVRVGAMRSDEQLRASLADTMDGVDGDVWVFGYGSLMWNPIICVAESRVVRITGYHRAFCLRSAAGRGSPERPGLMLGLDTGGSSGGLALRIARETLDDDLMLLWRREMSTGSYVPKWLSATGGDGEIRVLAFAANRQADNYVGSLTEEETAGLLSTGAGFLGTNLDYLVRTHRSLREHGIIDRKVDRLVRRCAVRTHEPDGAAPSPKGCP